MDVSELKQELAAAQERQDQASAALHGERQGREWEKTEWEEWEAAYEEVLRLEGLVAAAQGQEYAEPLSFPVRWDVGAPLPHLFNNGLRTLLTFYVRAPDQDWDGSYVTIRSPEEGGAEVLALVEFEGCASSRMGVPNDEVHHGHPLYGKGMRSYTAQEVRNSRWLAELEDINRVHNHFNPESWRDLRHYIFWFHDETVECIARGFKVEVYRESMAALLHRVVHRLLEE